MSNTVASPSTPREVVREALPNLFGASNPPMGEALRTELAAVAVAALEAAGFRVVRQTSVEVAGASVFGSGTSRVGLVWIDE